MTDSFIPTGLSKAEFIALNGCTGQVADLPESALLAEAEAHLDAARRAAENNCMVNVTLAAALLCSIRQLLADWDAVPPHAQPWCKGMIRYFTISNDDEDDFNSPLGFDDDATVINACLRLAGRDDLCINPEEYDDV